MRVRGKQWTQIVEAMALAAQLVQLHTTTLVYTSCGHEVSQL